MNANLIPEHSYLNRRIDRAYTRMLAAKTSKWAHAWANGMLSACRARNAMRTPAEIRAIEKARGLR
jgi:hypothetical protein